MILPALIFSRDRAMQLDALLTSIKRHAPFLLPTVLYRATTTAASAGYARCASRHDWVQWRREHDFQRDTLSLLDLWKHVCFLVDDDVFFAPAEEPTTFPWSWRPNEYDYPFALDGCAYDMEPLLPLLQSFRWSNPTQLEAGVDARRDALHFDRLSHGAPALVGIPANRVSESSNVPHMGGDAHELTTRYLAGEVIDLDAMPWAAVADAHEALPYAFATCT